MNAFFATKSQNSAAIVKAAVLAALLKEQWRFHTGVTALEAFNTLIAEIEAAP